VDKEFLDAQGEAAQKTKLRRSCSPSKTAAVCFKDPENVTMLGTHTPGAGEKRQKGANPPKNGKAASSGAGWVKPLLVNSPLHSPFESMFWPPNQKSRSILKF